MNICRIRVSVRYWLNIFNHDKFKSCIKDANGVIHHWHFHSRRTSKGPGGVWFASTYNISYILIRILCCLFVGLEWQSVTDWILLTTANSSLVIMMLMGSFVIGSCPMSTILFAFRWALEGQMPSCQRLPKLPAAAARVLHCRPTNCTYFNLTQFFNYKTSIEKLKAGSEVTGHSCTKNSRKTINSLSGLSIIRIMILEVIMCMEFIL